MFLSLRIAGLRALKHRECGIRSERDWSKSGVADCAVLCSHLCGYQEAGQAKIRAAGLSRNRVTRLRPGLVLILYY